MASAARLTLHIDLQAGTNAHHMIEACFKAFARALRQAVAIDPDETGVPSTKGTLTDDRDRRLRDGQPPQRREGARARGRRVRHHRRPRRDPRRRAIILPGVGAFPEAMRNLERTGLGEVLIERAAPACRCSGSASACS